MRGLSAEERAALQAFSMDQDFSIALVEQVICNFQRNHGLRRLRQFASGAVAARALSASLERFSVFDQGEKPSSYEEVGDMALRFYVDRRAPLFKHLSLPFSTVDRIDPNLRHFLPLRARARVRELQRNAIK